MKGRFSRTEAAGLFGLLFFCCLAFFLLGVYAGREFFPEPSPAAAQKPESSAQDTRPDLDFYKGLVPSGEGSAATELGAPEPPSPLSEAAEPNAPAGFQDAGQAAAGGTASPSGGPAAQPENESPQRSFWTVQVGALNTREEARQVILRLEAKGYSARVSEPAAGTTDFFRVWVGEFEDEAGARLFEGRLKADGFHTYPKKVQAPEVR